jgi:hypothetical protein
MIMIITTIQMQFLPQAAVQESGSVWMGRGVIGRGRGARVAHREELPGVVAQRKLDAPVHRLTAQLCKDSPFQASETVSITARQHSVPTRHAGVKSSHTHLPKKCTNTLTPPSVMPRVFTFRWKPSCPGGAGPSNTDASLSQSRIYSSNYIPLGVPTECSRLFQKASTQKAKLTLRWKPGCPGGAGPSNADASLSQSRPVNATRRDSAAANPR